MACNSFLIRVHGRVLSWCLCRVSAAEVLEVRFLPRCFFLARCSQAQSLLRCRSALHTLRLLLRSVCWQSRHSVCVKESWFRVFINAVQHFKVHKDYKQDAGVCAAASSLSVYTTLHFFSCLSLSYSVSFPLSLVSPDDGALRIWKNFADQKNPEMVTAWQGLSDMLPTTRGQPSISTHSKDQRSLLLCHQPIRSPTHTPKPQTVPKHPSHTSSLLRLQRRSERRVFSSLN